MPTTDLQQLNDWKNKIVSLIFSKIENKINTI